MNKLSIQIQIIHKFLMTVSNKIREKRVEAIMKRTFSRSITIDLHERHNFVREL